MFLFFICRQGTTDITKQFKITTGMKLTNSESLSTKFGFEYSLKSSASIGIEGVGKAGMEIQSKFSFSLEAGWSKSKEESWSKETTTTYIAPAGKKYRVLQTFIDFSSPLDSDNCCFYCRERIEESG